MDIHPIRTKQDYAAALKVASALVDADPAPARKRATNWTCFRS